MEGPHVCKNVSFVSTNSKEKRKEGGKNYTLVSVSDMKDIQQQIHVDKSLKEHTVNLVY
jgi:hypothetical protein